MSQFEDRVFSASCIMNTRTVYFSWKDRIFSIFEDRIFYVEGPYIFPRKTVYLIRNKCVRSRREVNLFVSMPIISKYLALSLMTINIWNSICKFNINCLLIIRIYVYPVLGRLLSVVIKIQIFVSITYYPYY